MLGFSQQSDFMNWYGVKLESDLFKEVEVQFESQLRTFENGTSLQRAYGELGISKTFAKIYSPSVSYRATVNSEGYGNRASLNHKLKFDLSKDIKLKYTLKTQLDWSAYSKTETRLRNKVELGYDLTKKIDVYFMSELFYAHKYDYSNFNQLRLGFGIDYKLKKRRHLELFFFNDREFNEFSPDTQWVLGIQYSWKRKDAIFNDK